MRPLNWIQWLTLALTVAFASLLVLGINVNSRSIQSNIRSIQSIQQNHRDTNRTLRTLLCFFESETLRSPQVSAEEKRHTAVVFTRALTLINEPACTKGESP